MERRMMLRTYIHHIAITFIKAPFFVLGTMSVINASQPSNTPKEHTQHSQIEDNVSEDTSLTLQEAFEITRAAHMHLHPDRKIFEDVNFRLGEVEMFTSRMVIDNDMLRIQNGLKYEYKKHNGTISDLIIDVKKKHLQLKGIKNYMPDKEMYITSANAEYQDGVFTMYDVAYYECNEKPQYAWKIRSKKVLYNKDETKICGAQLCVGKVPLVFYPGTLTINNIPRNNFHISIVPDIYWPSNVSLMLIPSLQLSFAYNNALCLKVPISLYGIVMGLMSYNLSQDKLKINLDGSITEASRTFKFSQTIQDDDRQYIEEIKRHRVRGHAHAYLEWLANDYLALRMQGHLVSDRFFAHNFSKFYPTYTPNMLHNYASIDFRKHSVDAHVGMHAFQGFREIPEQVCNRGMWYYGPLGTYQHAFPTKFGTFQAAVLGGYFRKANAFYCGNAMANLSYQKHISLHNILFEIEPSLSFSAYPTAYAANLVAQCRWPLYLQGLSFTPIVGQVLSFSNIKTQRGDIEPISMLHANRLDELCNEFSFQRKARTFAGASISIYNNHSRLLETKCIYSFDALNKKHHTYLEAQLIPSQQMCFFGRVMLDKSSCVFANIGVNLKLQVARINLGWFYRDSPQHHSFGLDSLLLSKNAIRNHQPINVRAFYTDIELMFNRHFSINAGVDLGDKNCKLVQGYISFTYKNKIFDITLGYARYNYAMGNLSPSHSVVFGLNLKELKFI